MKTLIVATDFSQEAENALEYAGAVAKYLNAKILLFNSFSFPIHASQARLSASSMQKLEEHKKILLQERAESLSKSYSIAVDFEYGLMLEVSEELDKLMAKHPGDMVVMGMAPRSLAQEIFGNTTTSVIMKHKYPVLAVPNNTVFSAINKILFACDELAEIPQQAMDKIRDLASIFRAEIEIFHVQEKVQKLGNGRAIPPTPNEGNEGLEGITHYYKNVESNEVIKEIEKEIKNSEADLLVMMPKEHGFWDSFIHRSKTRIMASNNDVPLFSVPI